MRLCDLAPAHIRAISPYQPGKPISELAREMGLDEASIVKLASNENPLGVGEKTREAMQRALADIARYPDGNGFELKDALCRRYGVALDQIVLGNGSNDVLEMVAGAFLGPEREAVFAQHAFAVYPLATQAAGARIANPNNPTGTFIPGPELEAFLARVPADVLVVLDEAYTEYLGPDQRYDAIAWIARFPNLLVSRTFSKAYGLAGLRVGYGLGNPAVIDLLNRVRQPFNVCSVGLAAAAAALFDDDFLARSYAANAAGMAQLTQGFQSLGLDWIPSAGNFVTFKVGDGAAVNAALLAQGVIVRPIAGYGMPEWLRVSIGLESENARFLEVLPDCLV
ncbi:MAG: histidinol-phosphate transaminase [Zoogloea sp.]|nr:histidinol-phosphate transaminase [Zoogloea sp.]